MSLLHGPRPRPRTPQQEFWAWFARAEGDLLAFGRDPERILDRLAAAMHRVHPDLTFEIGPVEEGRREFVVSAGGIRDAFPAVEALVAAGPPLAHWRVVKFRPRRLVEGVLELGETRVGAEDVWASVAPDGERWGLTLHVRGYQATADRRYEQLGYLWLDQALGEYDVETRIGYIEFASLDDAVAEVVPLRDLAAVIDRAPASE